MCKGTIAYIIYMSPEPTGRINRSIDFRTNFYSLGALFYQLLTGNYLKGIILYIKFTLVLQKMGSSKESMLKIYRMKLRHPL